MERGTQRGREKCIQWLKNKTGRSPIKTASFLDKFFESVRKKKTYEKKCNHYCSFGQDKQDHLRASVILLPHK